MMKVENRRKKEELPDGWKLTTLGDIAKWGSGGTPSRKNPAYYDGDIPWIKTGELGPKYIISTSEHISEEALKKSSAKIFPKGSVCIAMYGATIGKTSILGMDSSTNQACAVAVVDEEHVCNIYLYEYLCSQKRNFINAGIGGAQPNISQTVIKAWSFPLPPLNEQKRIVAKIEELFSEIDSGEQSLRDARKQLTLYRQSLLKQAFEGKLTGTWRQHNPDKLEDPKTLLARIQQERESRYQQQFQIWQQAVEQWEESGKDGKKPTKPRNLQPISPLSKEQLLKLPKVPKEWAFHRLDTISAIGSGVSVSRNRIVSNPIEVPYLRVANVQRGILKLDEIKTMTIDENRLDDLKIKHDDVLFNEGGDIDKLGRGWVWKSEMDTCITQNHVFRASMYSTSIIIPELVSHWGNAFGQDFFFKGGKQTTNLASISKTTLSSLPVPLPSPLEQLEIMRLLDEQFTAIEQNEKEITHSLTQSQALRQSILKKAFSGKFLLE